MSKRFDAPLLLRNSKHLFVCSFAAVGYAAYLLPGVDLVACVIKAWLLLTVVCVLVAGWRFSPMLTVRTWFTGPWKDRGDVRRSTSRSSFTKLNTAGTSQCRKLCCAFTNRSAQILLFLLIFSLTGVSAASPRSSERPTRVPVAVEKRLNLILCFIK